MFKQVLPDFKQYQAFFQAVIFVRIFVQVKRKLIVYLKDNLLKYRI